MSTLPAARQHVAVATTAVVIGLVVVIAVAGIGTYVFVIAHGNTGTRTSALTTSTGSTLTIRTVVTGTTTSGGTTSNQHGFQNYSGTFSYTNPLGPFGINDSSGKPVEWNSTETASGSFSFSINPAAYLGTGYGHGDMIVTTRGYCTGTVTVPYTFTVQVAHPPGANYEIAFDVPTPSTAVVQLTCQGPTKGFNQANNPVSFLSVYPNGLSVASLPTTASQNLTAGISYTVTIT